MPTGFKIPIRANSNGGISLVSGNENNNKIIKVGLSSTDNKNAFQQDLGIGQGMIFDISDSALRGFLVSKIKKLFAAFELQKRFKLLTDTLEWTEDEESEELRLDLRYIDLETDEEKEFSRNFKAGD